MHTVSGARPGGGHGLCMDIVFGVSSNSTNASDGAVAAGCDEADDVAEEDEEDDDDGRCVTTRVFDAFSTRPSTWNGIRTTGMLLRVNSMPHPDPSGDDTAHTRVVQRGSCMPTWFSLLLGVSLLIGFHCLVVFSLSLYRDDADDGT